MVYDASLVLLAFEVLSSNTGQVVELRCLCVLSEIRVVMVECCPFEHRKIGSVSVSREHVGFHAHFVENAEFVVEVITSAAVLIIFFVHLLEGSQGVPVSWFVVVGSIPLSGISEVFDLVIISEVFVIIPAITPISVSRSEIIWSFVLVIAGVSCIILIPIIVPICCLRGPHGFFMRSGALLGWLVCGLSRGLSQGLIQG